MSTYFKKTLLVCIGCMLVGIELMAKEAPEKLYSRGTLLMEGESKRVLYEGHGYDELPMASTTKIMTCLLAIEEGNLEDVVTASKSAARAPKVKLGIREGEKQTLEDLLYSLMLESHNDSAVAIAEHIGGSVEKFCEMMTERAQEMGALHTSFKTPNGLDADGHYATPHDMALITSYAIQNPKFLQITQTLDKAIPSNPLEGSRPHHLINKNRFLREYMGAISGKTGYTSKAGHCFVGAAEREGMQLIGVALGAGCDKAAKTRKYTDVKSMISFGYQNYKKYQVTEVGEEMGSIAINGGKIEAVEVCLQEKIILPLSKKETEEIQLKVTMPTQMDAPIKKDEVVGKVEVVCGEEILKTTDLYVENTVEKATLWDKILKFFEQE